MMPPSSSPLTSRITTMTEQSLAQLLQEVEAWSNEHVNITDRGAKVMWMGRGARLAIALATALSVENVAAAIRATPALPADEKADALLRAIPVDTE